MGEVVEADFEDADFDAKGKRVKKPTAKYKGYVEMFQKVLGELKKDIFSGELMWWDSRSTRWVSVFDDEAHGKLAVMARESKGFYNVSAIDDYLHALRAQTSAEFLVTLPEWDGIDRLAVVADCLICNNFTREQVYDLLCDWGARAFRRLDNCKEANRILLLKGPQGIGKDYLVQALCDGLGQFFIPFTVHQQERDTYEQLAAALVLNISEFDRTNKTEVSQLKNMITAPAVRYRAPYAAAAVYRPARCSFIATSNIDNLLRDSTGNRRWVILDVERIVKDGYPAHESPQILAQWYRLAQEGYQASVETERVLALYIGDQTPEDLEDEICRDWEEIMVSNPNGRANSDLEDEWKKMLRLHSGYSLNSIRGILKRKGYFKRTERARVYTGVSSRMTPSSVKVVSGDDRSSVRNVTLMTRDDTEIF